MVQIYYEYQWEHHTSLRQPQAQRKLLIVTRRGSNASQNRMHFNIT